MTSAEQLVQYFAYGSMVNPVSKKRRGVVPSLSCPAKLPGYALVFGGASGMANIRADPTATMQGVVHTVTRKEWEVLMDVEGVYDVTTVTVQPYSTDAPGEQLEPVEAQAFIITKEGPVLQPSLPSERYLDIITQGLAHYKVDPDYIAWLGAHPHTPRKAPADFCVAVTPTPLQELPVWTREQLAAWRNAIGEGGVVHLAVGPKVIRLEGLPAAPGQEADPDLHPYVVLLLRYLAGQSCAYGLCMNLYEPQLPPLETEADLTPEHLAWAEDFVVSGVERVQATATVVGRLQEEGGDQEEAGGRVPVVPDAQENAELAAAEAEAAAPPGAGGGQGEGV